MGRALQTLRRLLLLAAVLVGAALSQGAQAPASALQIATAAGKAVLAQNAQRPLQVAANLTRGQYASDTTTSGNEMRQVRAPHYVAVATRQIWIVYANWWLDIGAGGREVANGNAVTLGAALEYNGITVVAPNASSYTLANDETFLAGPFNATSFGVSAFPAGAQIFSRTVETVAVGQNITRAGQYLSEAPASRLQSAAGASQLSGTGVYVGANNTNGPSPIMVLGRTVAPAASIIEIGDSIGEGQADSNQYPNAANAGGYVQRGAWGANKTAIAQLGRHGGQLSRLFNGTDGSRRAALYKYATSTIIAFGANDLFNPNTAPTFLTNYASLTSIMRAAGVKYVVAAGVAPRTSSTDSWATVVNQSQQTNWDPAKVDVVNAALAALTPGNNVYFNVLTDWGDSGADLAWVVTGAANYATVDGTHPSAALSPAAGARMTTVVNAMPKY